MKILSKDHKILDIGCGNSKIIINLYDKGFSHIEAIDYSEYAI